MDISGKVGLVTGAACGIGKKLVDGLLHNGAKGVVILDINESNGVDTKEEFEDKYGSGKVVFLKCDVTKKDQLKAGFELTKSTYGQVNIVCNNAGFCDEIDWEKMIEVNINGVISGTQLAIEYLDNQGVIINMSSVSGLSLALLVPVYATTKAAVIAYTRNIAKFDPTVEAKSIRLNCLCPTDVEGTNFILTARLEEKYKEQSAIVLAKAPKITTEEVACAFMRAVQENHHNQTLYIHPGEITFVEDHTNSFRKTYNIKLELLDC